MANYGYGLNNLFRNRGDGTFEDVGFVTGVDSDHRAGGGNTFGMDLGDVDGDGHLDLYIADLSHPRYQPGSDISRLLMSTGPPHWEFNNEFSQRGLVWDEGDINPSFVDVDNDGDLDLFLAQIYPLHSARLYRLEESGVYRDVSYEYGLDVPVCGRQAWADIDGDGDLDLVAQDGPAAQMRLFENRRGQDSPSVMLRLVGTRSNGAALGARVIAIVGDRTLVREVRSAKGHMGAMHTLEVHLGLGSASQIDTLTITWPAGAQESFGVVAPGRYRAVEGTGTLTQF